MPLPDRETEPQYRRGPVRTLDVGGWQGQAAQAVETVRSLFHDMRQPLTALRVLVESGRGEPDDPVRSSIIEEVDWLTVLVDSVLGEPTDSGPVAFWLGEVALAAVRLERMSKACRIGLDIRDPVRLEGRPVAMQRALLCLLDNATRAASEEGHVHVVVERRGSYGTLSVVDDGPGLGRLARQHSLGLSTVRAVVADIGGHFSLANGPGGGAVASIHVPAPAGDAGW